MNPHILLKRILTLFEPWGTHTERSLRPQYMPLFDVRMTVNSVRRHASSLTYEIFCLQQHEVPYSIAGAVVEWYMYDGMSVLSSSLSTPKYSDGLASTTITCCP